MTSVGAAVAMSISPTLSAEPVSRKTRMPAASSVSALPAVETSWAVHSSVKSRLRKTAYGEGRRAETVAVIATLSRAGPVG